MKNYIIPKGNWKPIKGFEDYLISDDGRIYSKKVRRLLKTSAKPNGYIIVGLWKNNKGKHLYIHRLVLINFCDEELKETVNHKDGDKSNNHISNLEWMTYKENNEHAYKTGLNDYTHRRNCKGSKQVEQWSKEGKLLKIYPSMRQVERETGIDATAIGHGIRKGWKYGGFVWKFHKNNETV